MRSSLRLLVLAGTLAVSSCATLNESECRSVNWQELGHRDGAGGYPRSRLEEHRKACSEFGLAADDAAWRQGYDDGLGDYCTTENGYRVGLRGGYYAQVCPVADEAEFVAAYELGRETYDVEREIGEVSRRIESLESRLRSDKIDDSVRSDVRRQLYDAYNQMTWLRRSRDRLESEWRRRY